MEGIELEVASFAIKLGCSESPADSAESSECAGAPASNPAEDSRPSDALLLSDGEPARVDDAGELKADELKEIVEAESRM